MFLLQYFILSLFVLHIIKVHKPVHVPKFMKRIRGNMMPSYVNKNIAYMRQQFYSKDGCKYVVQRRLIRRQLVRKFKEEGEQFVSEIMRLKWWMDWEKSCINTCVKTYLQMLTSKQILNTKTALYIQKKNYSRELMEFVCTSLDDNVNMKNLYSWVEHWYYYLFQNCSLYYTEEPVLV